MQLGQGAEWIVRQSRSRGAHLLGGSICEDIAIGGLVFRHGPSLTAAPDEIAGHLHPCKNIVRRGRIIRRQCFASDGSRLVMPAFGA